MLSFNADARKAKEGLGTVWQPDGTSFLATLRGDEFGHIMTTAAGNAIVQDSEGYYCYANFDEYGNIMNSGSRVGLSADPEDVRRSLDIPYGIIASRASAKRAAFPRREENHIQRLNARYGHISPDGTLIATKADAAVTKHCLVLLVNFKDVNMRYSADEFQNMLMEEGYSKYNGTGSARDYFHAQFGNLYDFDFRVYGPYTLSGDRADYGANDSDRNDVNPAGMVSEACTLADGDVDFSIFDDDGDGEVDNVFIFFAGGDEAEYAGDECIWSHAWSMEAAGIELSLDGKTVGSYACTSELTTSDRGKNYRMAGIGTFCHEYSHTLGLMDLYDTDYTESGGQSNGMWVSTSLMDGGNMNNDGRTPPNYNAIERETLGIGSAQELVPGAATLEAVNSGNTYYKIAGTVAKEFYLIECRQASGWDKYIGGNGVLVYHVDKSRNSAGKSKNWGRTLTAEQRWYYNEVNANPAHECARLVTPVSSPMNVAQVFFPYASYDSISPSDNASIKFWNGETAAISLKEISFSEGAASFIAVIGDDDGGITPPAVASEQHEAFQNAAVVRFFPDRSFNGEGKVLWGPSGKAETTVTAKACSDGSYAVVLEGLTPATSYECKCWFEKNGVSGLSQTVKFMTARRQSTGYPYIYINNVERNSDGSIKKGALIPLRIFNPDDKEHVVYWTLDGKPVERADNGYWTAEVGGVLKAEIAYKDGSRDAVAKELTVK